MEQAAAEWRYGSLHKDRPFHDGSFTSWSKERTPEYPFYFADGVKIWAAPVDVNPNDQFLSEESADPNASG